MSEERKEIRISFPESLQAGVYANNMSVAHTREEFIIDYLFVAPPGGTVTARVITSPGHLKRMIAALQENLAHYEKNFGPVEAASPPGSGVAPGTSTRQ